MVLLLIASLIPAYVYHTCLGGMCSDWWWDPAWACGEISGGKEVDFQFTEIWDFLGWGGKRGATFVVK